MMDCHHQGPFATLVSCVHLVLLALAVTVFGVHLGVCLKSPWFSRFDWASKCKAQPCFARQLPKLVCLVALGFSPLACLNLAGAACLDVILLVGQFVCQEVRGGAPVDDVALAVPLDLCFSFLLLGVAQGKIDLHFSWVLANLVMSFSVSAIPLVFGHKLPSGGSQGQSTSAEQRHAESIAAGLSRNSSGNDRSTAHGPSTVTDSSAFNSRRSSLHVSNHLTATQLESLVQSQGGYSKPTDSQCGSSTSSVVEQLQASHAPRMTATPVHKLSTVTLPTDTIQQDPTSALIMRSNGMAIELLDKHGRSMHYTSRVRRQRVYIKTGVGGLKDARLQQLLPRVQHTLHTSPAQLQPRMHSQPQAPGVSAIRDAAKAEPRLPSHPQEPSIPSTNDAAAAQGPRSTAQAISNNQTPASGTCTNVSHQAPYRLGALHKPRLVPNHHTSATGAFHARPLSGGAPLRPTNLSCTQPNPGAPKPTTHPGMQPNPCTSAAPGAAQTKSTSLPSAVSGAALSADTADASEVPGATQTKSTISASAMVGTAPVSPGDDCHYAGGSQSCGMALSSHAPRFVSSPAAVGGGVLWVGEPGRAVEQQQIGQACGHVQPGTRAYGGISASEQGLPDSPQASTQYQPMQQQQQLQQVGLAQQQQQQQPQMDCSLKQGTEAHSQQQQQELQHCSNQGEERPQQLPGPPSVLPLQQQQQQEQLLGPPSALPSQLQQQQQQQRQHSSKDHAPSSSQHQARSNQQRPLFGGVYMRDGCVEMTLDLLTFMPPSPQTLPAFDSSSSSLTNAQGVSSETICSRVSSVPPHPASSSSGQGNRSDTTGLWPRLPQDPSSWLDVMGLSHRQPRFLRSHLPAQLCQANEQGFTSSISSTEDEDTSYYDPYLKLQLGEGEAVRTWRHQPRLQSTPSSLLDSPQPNFMHQQGWHLKQHQGAGSLNPCPEARPAAQLLGVYPHVIVAQQPDSHGSSSCHSDAHRDTASRPSHAAAGVAHHLGSAQAPACPRVHLYVLLSNTTACGEGCTMQQQQQGIQNISIAARHQGRYLRARVLSRVCPRGKSSGSAGAGAAAAACNYSGAAPGALAVLEVELAAQLCPGLVHFEVCMPGMDSPSASAHTLVVGQDCAHMAAELQQLQPGCEARARQEATVRGWELVQQQNRRQQQRQQTQEPEAEFAVRGGKQLGGCEDNNTEDVCSSVDGSASGPRFSPVPTLPPAVAGPAALLHDIGVWLELEGAAEAAASAGLCTPTSGAQPHHHHRLHLPHPHLRHAMGCSSTLPDAAPGSADLLAQFARGMACVHAQMASEVRSLAHHLAATADSLGWTHTASYLRTSQRSCPHSRHTPARPDLVALSSSMQHMQARSHSRLENDRCSEQPFILTSIDRSRSCERRRITPSSSCKCTLHSMPSTQSQHTAQRPHHAHMRACQNEPAGQPVTEQGKQSVRTPHGSILCPAAAAAVSPAFAASPLDNNNFSWAAGLLARYACGSASTVAAAMAVPSAAASAAMMVVA